MTGEHLVAILAGIVDAAALHFDGDNVRGTAVVLAASLRVEIAAAHEW